jgi:glycerophosphoryl diester phosphodiesterase
MVIDSSRRNRGMREHLQSALTSTIDLAAAAIPRRVPSRATLQQCKIISHRGENDNREILENTLAAFAAARAAGVWGVECDIRWTRDLVPVIYHDPGCERLFGDPVTIASLEFSVLRERFPLIPSLQELVGEFAGNTHLMLEIKAESYPKPARQKAILQAILSSLTPGDDYHFLMLDPVLAARVDFVPREFSLLVAEFNLHRLSRECLQQGFGGLMGHYLLLNDTVKRRHEGAGQRVGTGFIHSGNVLFRELNRGVEWIFSNEAVKMQNIRDAALR